MLLPDDRDGQLLPQHFPASMTRLATCESMSCGVRALLLWMSVLFPWRCWAVSFLSAVLTHGQHDLF